MKRKKIGKESPVRNAYYGTNSQTPREETSYMCAFVCSSCKLATDERPLQTWPFKWHPGAILGPWRARAHLYMSGGGCSPVASMGKQQANKPSIHHGERGKKAAPHLAVLVDSKAGDTRAVALHPEQSFGSCEFALPDSRSDESLLWRRR